MSNRADEEVVDLVADSDDEGGDSGVKLDETAAVDRADTKQLSEAVLEELMEQFRLVTSTDSIVAHMFLQQHEWSLEVAVDAFFHEMGLSENLGVRLNSKPAQEDAKHVSLIEPTKQPTGVSANNLSGPSSSSLDIVDALNSTADAPAPRDFTVLSWNVDGLDEHSLVTRTKAAIATIAKIKPTVVFLQEVVPESYSLFDGSLGPLYTVLAADDNGASGYFAMMLLLKARMAVCDYHTEKFPRSGMGRGLLKCTACLDGAYPFTLLTTHLESCKEHSRERVSQLKRCFQVVQDTPEASSVIFGGDLNLRDPEVASAGDVAENTVDLWTACGSPKQHKFTWDTLKNDNTSMATGFKPRTRYDRLYWRPGLIQASIADADRTSSAEIGASRWHPTEFVLVGQQRIRTTLCFPSDHFGVLCRFMKK